jgi:hypothetical protein
LGPGPSRLHSPSPRLRRRRAGDRAAFLRLGCGGCGLRGRMNCERSLAHSRCAALLAAFALLITALSACGGTQHSNPPTDGSNSAPASPERVPERVPATHQQMSSSSSRGVVDSHTGTRAGHASRDSSQSAAASPVQISGPHRRGTTGAQNTTAKQEQTSLPRRPPPAVRSTATSDSSVHQEPQRPPPGRSTAGQ